MSAATPASAWILLALAVFGALATLTAVARADRLGWGNTFWFLSSWLTSELALFHVLLSLAVVLVFCAATQALEHWPGRLAVGVVALSWFGLAVAQWRARQARPALERALEAGLGSDYVERIPLPRRAVLEDDVTWLELARPFSLRRGPVERLRDLPYESSGHVRHTLDVYRPATGCRNAPVLLQIHGGAWVLGNKHEQALPLIYHLAARGWVVVTPNYRLSPRVRFPEHLHDCKRALAWTRAHAEELGGDPTFIAVTGGSAGGHLCSLLALTQNERSLQPGFEHADTSVAACVPFYGVYDFTDRHGLKGSGPQMVAWLERNVMPASPAERPDLWDLASPITRIRADAPPFFVLHGTHDSLASTAEARLFVESLRGVSHQPVVYAELPGAQHAWEVFRSVRAMHSVHAVSLFLEWCRASR